MNTNGEWTFADARNVAVFTSRKIVLGVDRVHYVTHDHEDGAWQFHPYGELTPEWDAVVISLETMVRIDETLKMLADLPCGWHAWRKTYDSVWQRSRIV